MTEEAEELKNQLISAAGDEEQPVLPVIPANAHLCVPSPPIIRPDRRGLADTTSGMELNWPLLSVQLDVFEAAIAQRRTTALKTGETDAGKLSVTPAGGMGLLEATDADEAAWGQDADLDLDGMLILL